MLKHVTILLLACLLYSASSAQEYNFAQYYLDKLGISPAFVSVGDYNEVGFAIRSQWPGVDGGYKIYMAEYQQKLPTYSSGIGMRIYGDYGGQSAFSTTCADLLYGYDFGITDRIKCSFGLSAGFIGRFVRQENMVYYSMIDPATGNIGGATEMLPADAYRSLTFSTGFAVYTKETMVASGLHRLANMVISGDGNYSPSVIAGAVYSADIVLHPLQIRQYDNARRVLFGLPTAALARLSHGKGRQDGVVGGDGRRVRLRKSGTKHRPRTRNIVGLEANLRLIRSGN